MAAALGETVILEGEQVTILTATERATASLARAFADRDVRALKLPQTW